MFDRCVSSSDGRESAGAELLRSAVADLLARRVWIIDHEPHGRREQTSAPECAEREGSGFRRLLEDGAGHLAVAKEAAREQSRQAAVQARALAGFARCRPGGVLDRPAEEVGAAAAASRAARPRVLTEVSEWAVDEVMASLGLSSRAAGRLLAESLTLVEQLPATLAAVEQGALGWAQARMLAEVLAPLPEEVRAGVEAGLLAGAAGKTVSALRAAASRAVLRADAAGAAARLAVAVRDRQVRLFPGEDGMATLAAVMSVPVAAACLRALEAYAEACVTPGDQRSKAQRMVDCLTELILGPGENGLPPVQVVLTVVAGVDTMRGGPEPGEVEGQPVPAVLVRELAHTLGLLPHPEQDHTDRTEPEAPVEPEQQPAEPPPDHPEQHRPEQHHPGQKQPDGLGGSEGSQGSREGAGPGAEGRVLSANERAAANLAALLGIPTTAGTTLAQLPAIAVVEEITGELLALTDAATMSRLATCQRTRCRTGRRACTHPAPGPGLGPPATSPGYVPRAALARFIRFRDRRCRFPGCRAAAVRCDLDHTIPWPHGTTSADNLCCLCRHHHRLSHQAPGWALHRLPDGGLQWTTPGGEKFITYPPRYGTDDHPPPGSQPRPQPGPEPGSPQAPSPDELRRPTTTPPHPRSQPPPTLRERVLGRPRGSDEPADDPQPF